MSDADALRCITCHKDYQPGSALIHARLATFDDACICEECVDVAQKRTPPQPRDGG